MNANLFFTLCSFCIAMDAMAYLQLIYHDLPDLNIVNFATSNNQRVW
jgi:hypothetical protein